MDNNPFNTRIGLHIIQTRELWKDKDWSLCSGTESLQESTKDVTLTHIKGYIALLNVSPREPFIFCLGLLGMGQDSRGGKVWKMPTLEMQMLN